MSNHITLNGESRAFPAGITLAGIVESLQLPEDRLAIEYNRGIVSRSHWANTVVAPGAEIEIVQFVGGG